MKLLNLFVFFFLFSPLYLCAQKKDISGHYVHSDYPESIDIEGSNFIYKKIRAIILFMIMTLWLIAHGSGLTKTLY